MKNIRLMQSIVLVSVFFVIVMMPVAARGDPNSSAENENFFKNLHKSVGLVVGENSSGPASKRPIGTAFIVSKDGMMLTNAHVVAGEKNLSIFFNNNELAAKKRSVRVILSDNVLDIAVLKIIPENNEVFEPLSFGNAQELIAGYSDITIPGYPAYLGGKRLYIANGKVTQTEVWLLPDTGLGFGSSYIATNLIEGKGASGGPCLHKNKVVGIAAVVVSPSSSNTVIGPAMCISGIFAEQVLQKAIEGQRVVHGYIKIDVAEFPVGFVMELDRYKYVFPEEPPRVVVVNGYNNGLRPLDRIFSVTFTNEEGQECTVPIYTILDFKRVSSNLSPGTFITITIVRAGEEMRLRLLIEDPVAAVPEH